MGMNPRLLRPLASRGFKYAALRQGLVAYWPLNETAPSGDVTAIDNSGRNNDLTSNNTVPSGTGKVGNGRVFASANSEYLGRASNSDLQFGDGNWSLSFWYFPTAADPPSGSIFQHVIGKDQSGGRELGIRSVTGASNRIQAFVFHTDETFVELNQLNQTYPLYVNQWWHCVVTHNNGALALWMNGSTAATGSRAAGKTFAATSTQFNIGRRSFASPFFDFYDGTVDEVAKWNRAITSSEIAELYNSGNGIDLSATS
jgi:hypothetical protein